MLKRDTETTEVQKSQFILEGMTCESCVKVVSERLNEISGVISARVDLKSKIVTINSSRRIELSDLKNALSDLPKYKISEWASTMAGSQNERMGGFSETLKTYKPLVAIFIFILLVSLAVQLGQGFFDFRKFIDHLMAGFFIGLSYFKFLDLKAFAESFKGYDPLAKRIKSYGFIYPFIELTLGLMFIARIAHFWANILTILILLPTTLGVYMKLRSKTMITCACLGTSFNLPLSNVTIAENLAMVTMAVYGLVV